MMKFDYKLKQPFVVTIKKSNPLFIKVFENDKLVGMLSGDDLARFAKLEQNPKLALKVYKLMMEEL